jgi:flagellar FliL protein
MANSEEAPQISAVTPASKLAIFPLMIAMIGAVLAAVLLIAGTGYLLVRSGRLGLPTANQSSAKTSPAIQVEAAATHTMTLEPMVANLADADGKAFLRIGLTLRVFDTAISKEEKTKDEKPKDSKHADEAEAAVRDVALEVFGRKTSESLLGADGKEHLKVELKQELAKHAPELKVADIFLTEFLVQR